MSKRKKINPGKTNENQKTFESVAERKRRNGGNEQQILNKPFLFQFLFILLFLIVGFTIYSNTFMTPFVFDDLKIIKNNRSIRIEKLTAENIINSAVGVSSNRPISTLTFALNYYFDRYNLKGYHLVNIIIHITNAIILFFFIKLTFSVARRQQIPNTKYRSSAALWISFITAFIWLANPIQTQSVTYIVQRMNSMGASFFLLTLLFYAKGRIAQLNISFKSYGGNHYGNAKKRLSSYHVWFFASGVSGLLAFGSKESTAVLPFFILLYEWYFFQDLNKKSLKTYLKYIVPFIILLALIAFLYLGIDPGEKLKNLNDFKNEEFTVLQRVLTQPRVVIYYVSLIFFPHPSRLNLDYDFPLSYTLINPVTTIIALGAVIGLLAFAFFLAKRERLISFCILWFFGNLVIESSIVPLAIIFEHRNYLPSMMVGLIPVLLAYRYLKIGWLRIGIVSVVIIMLAVWTYQRNRVWESKLSLWADVVKKSPNKERPHTNLGSALLNQEELDKAIEHFKTALQLQPKYPETQLNMGVALARQGQTDEAIAYYRKALQIQPNFPEAHNNLGLALKKQGKTSEAIEHYKKALQINPGFMETYDSLGAALVVLGKTDEAIKHYKKALQMDPYYVRAYHSLGVILADIGKTDEANEHYKKALQIDPDFAKAHINLGVVLAKQGKTDEAIEHYNKALELNPEDIEALFNMGDALVKQGETEQAINYLNKAVQINPDYAEAHSNLGSIYTKQGNLEKAIYHSNEALRLNPQLVEPHNNLGIALMQEGKIEAAISQFQKALQVKPDFILAENNLNRALAIRQELETEISRLQELLKENPDNVELHFQLGNLFFRKGDQRHAIQQYKKALQLSPKFVPALNNLALVHAANKEYSKALTLFLDMLNYHPDDAETHYNIACMYSRLKKVDASIEWLKKAIDRGYTNWESIKKDGDLDNIRDAAGYKELIEGH